MLSGLKEDLHVGGSSGVARVSRGPWYKGVFKGGQGVHPQKFSDFFEM